MKAYNGFKAQQDTSNNRLPDIPAGVYVGKIIQAKEESDQYGDIIALAVEVAEGDFKGYFKRQYDSRTGGQFEAKYKGSMRLRVPTGNESENESWRRRAFENNIWAVEASNPGYRFDWTAKSMVGKLVGLNIREREWEFNGNTGVATEICRFECVDDVRKGTVKPAKRRTLQQPTNNGSSAAATAESAFKPVEVDEEEFPF